MQQDITEAMIVAEMQRTFPRELQISVLTVTNRLQTAEIQRLNDAYMHALSNPRPTPGEDAGFWDKSTEKRVPLSPEKE